MKRVVGREAYFTDLDLARRCIDFTDALAGLDRFSLIVEPSAGAGAFFDQLPERLRVGIDIEPRHPGVVQADFLTWRAPKTPGPVLTIGNPPFGQRGALAVAFLTAACAFSDVVALILPRSFNKYTFQDRVPPPFHLAGSFDCADFHAPGGAPARVKSVFQVWEKRDTVRARSALATTHPHFDMRHCHLSRASAAEMSRLRSDYPFAVAQVGSNFAPRDSAGVTRGSHWFIRPHVPGVRETFERLDFAFLDAMNTAHKSLSRRDIVSAYAAIVERSLGE